MSTVSTPDLTDSPPPAGATGVPLTRRETREVITPYAFEVCPSLLGVPTASPMRRLLAISIDGLVVTGLAKAALLCIVPVIAYLAYSRWQAKRIGQFLLVLLFGLLWSTSATLVPEWVSTSDVAEFAMPEGGKLSKTEALTVTGVALALQQEHCEQACVTELLTKTAQQLHQQGSSKEQARHILDSLVESTDYPTAQWPALQQQLLSVYSAVDAQVPAVQTASQAAVASHAPSSQHNTAIPVWLQEGAAPSMLGWLKGILSDIGVGFGWAAAYFTLTVAWCNGQSLGKKLMKIKVIQIDGKDLGIMAAFGRQGGYGAGFATGLLGFAQVCWDPNRQAIQDKVASTVVIRLYQPKRPLTH